MDGLTAIIILFIAIVTGSAAVGAYERGDNLWTVTWGIACFANAASFVFSIQS